MPDDLDALSDTELIERSRSGDQHAFGLVVTRYQSLVCSVAYNRCGDLALSEDLAQDAFLQAWKKLSDLREASSFKSWICTIVRNLTSRAGKRNCNHRTLDDAGDVRSETESPVQQAVTAEVEQLVWQALEGIPESYREPMILFYREDQSVARVAEGLELTQDTVKKRLSRGRKMLQSRLASTVETTLTQSRPSKGFTATVVAGIAGLTSKSATAAGVATATTASTTSAAATKVAKASAAKVMKTGLLAGVGSSIGVMFISLLAQIPVLRWMERESDKSAERLSEEELKLVDQMSFRRPWGGPNARVAIFFGCGAITYWMSSKWGYEFSGFGPAIIWFALFIACNLPFFLYDRRLYIQMRQQQIAAGTFTPDRRLVISDNPKVVVWKTLLLIAVGGYMIIAWTILLAIYHSDWSIVPVVFVGSSAISLIAWLCALRFPAQSAACCAMSLPATSLFGISIMMLRRTVWAHDIAHIGWYFAAMVGTGMTTAVLCMLNSVRSEAACYQAASKSN